MLLGIVCRCSDLVRLASAGLRRRRGRWDRHRRRRHVVAIGSIGCVPRDAAKGALSASLRASSEPGLGLAVMKGCLLVTNECLGTTRSPADGEYSRQGSYWQGNGKKGISDRRPWPDGAANFFNCWPPAPFRTRSREARQRSGPAVPRRPLRTDAAIRRLISFLSSSSAQGGRPCQRIIGPKWTSRGNTQHPPGWRP